jgi:hypothetical protein
MPKLNLDSKKKAAKKTTSKKTAGKGITKKNISFKDCTDTLEEVFGNKPIARFEVVSIISKYIRDNDCVIE